jgi:hypothetical protein
MTQPTKVGGRRPGAGRKKGGTNKLTGEAILKAINKECGKPFEQLLAEGYHASVLAMDMPVRQKYEQMILSKVVADKHEIDHTTLGQSMHAVFNFPKQELPDWTDVPVTITLDAKSN